MIRFESDYLEGALPEVMRALCETNYVQTPGYGEDEYCAAAAAKIREKCAAPGAAVHFLVGGTQVNLTVIAAALRPHQAAIAAASGHIAVHESGLRRGDGAQGRRPALRRGREDKRRAGARVRRGPLGRLHARAPASARRSSISPSPPRTGPIYSLAELEALCAVCREKGLIFFVDGARLGTALVCPGADASLADLARLADAFYIGGTKLGALFGEARRHHEPGAQPRLPLYRASSAAGCSRRAACWACSSARS